MVKFVGSILCYDFMGKKIKCEQFLVLVLNHRNLNRHISYNHIINTAKYTFKVKAWRKTQTNQSANVMLENALNNLSSDTGIYPYCQFPKLLFCMDAGVSLAHWVYISVL